MRNTFDRTTGVRLTDADGSAIATRRKLTLSDIAWLAVLVVNTGFWVYVSYRGLTLGHSTTVKAWQFDFPFAYILLPFCALLLLRVRGSGSASVSALYRASALAGAIAFACALVIALAGWHFLWPQWTVQPNPLVAAWGVMTLVGVPLILLPVSAYVSKAQTPRALPVMGMTSALLILVSLQPYLSLLVFGGAAGVGRLRGTGGVVSNKRIERTP